MPPAPTSMITSISFCKFVQRIFSFNRIACKKAKPEISQLLPLPLVETKKQKKIDGHMYGGFTAD